MKLEDIIVAVSNFYDMPQHLILSRNRQSRIVRARFVLVYVAYTYGFDDLTIAKKLNRDRSTICTARNKIVWVVENDMLLKSEIIAITNMLGGKK